MAYDQRTFEDRAKRYPAWLRVKVYDGDGLRHLTPHEVCILAEVFEDARERYLRGGPVEELGITLGVLKETER